VAWRTKIGSDYIFGNEVTSSGWLMYSYQAPVSDYIWNLGYTGQLQLFKYGTGTTFTGTAHKMLGVNTAGTVVAVDPVSGDRVELQNRTFSGNDTVKIELAAWYATYSRFEIEFEELQGTTNTSNLRMQVILNGSSTPLTTSSYKVNTNLGADPGAATYSQIWLTMENTTDDPDAVVNGTIRITKPNSAKKKVITTEFRGTNNFGSAEHNLVNTVVTSTTAIDQLYIFSNGTGFGGNLQGKVKIVGYKN
jgi:hypothetical protein